MGWCFRRGCRFYRERERERKEMDRYILVVYINFDQQSVQLSLFSKFARQMGEGRYDKLSEGENYWLVGHVQNAKALHQKADCRWQMPKHHQGNRSSPKQHWVTAFRQKDRTRTWTKKSQS